MPHISDELRDAADELGCEVCERCGAFYNATPDNVDHGHDCATPAAAQDAEVNE